MATAQVLSEVDDLLTCSICLELLNDPHTLQQCFHSYCKECAETKIERKYDDGRLGVYCPICRTFSSNDEIKSNFFVNNMLEKRAKLQSQNKPQCNQCNNKDATQRCVECKMYLCDPCKAMHLSIPLLQEHEVLPFYGTEDLVVDMLMPCPHHNDKAMEFNCKICETLLCIKCKIIGHENHQTETIETALERLLPQMKQNTKKLDENLEKLEEQIQEIDGKMTDIKTKYESCFCEIKESADLAISLIKHEQNRLEQEVEDKLLSEQKKLQSIRDNLQMKKDAGSNFSKLVYTCLQKARHTSQLAEIQGGLYDKVEENSKPIEPIKPLDITIPNYKMSMGFINLAEEEKFLGRIEYTNTNIFSENLPAKTIQAEKFEFNKCLSKKINKRRIIELPKNVAYLCLISDSIWVCLSTTRIINVYTLAGAMVKCLTFSDHQPMSVHPLCESRLVITSCNRGLYEIIARNIRVQTAILEKADVGQEIATGNFCSVFTNKNELFTLENNLKILLHYRCDLEGGEIQYTQMNVINLADHGDFKCMDVDATLCADTTHIYILADKKQVYKFTRNGKLVDTLGKQAGMSDPVICGVDSTGCLLIIDHGNKCLKVLYSEGKDKGKCEEYNLNQIGKPVFADVDSHLSVWCVEGLMYSLVQY